MTAATAYCTNRNASAPPLHEGPARASQSSGSPWRSISRRSRSSSSRALSSRRRRSSVPPPTASTCNDATRSCRRLFDRDNSGSISAQELGDVLRSLGQKPTAEELHEMIAELDGDKSGLVDLQEFLDLMGRKESELKEVRAAFRCGSSGSLCAALCPAPRCALAGLAGSLQPSPSPQAAAPGRPTARPPALPLPPAASSTGEATATSRWRTCARR